MAKPLVRPWSFAETLASASAIDQVGAAFLEETARLGFKHVELRADVDPRFPEPVAFVRLPKAWAARYIGEDYFRHDPIQREARARATPFSLSEIAFRDGLTALEGKVLDERRRARLGDGLAIPLATPGQPPAACVLYAGANVDPRSFPLGHSAAVLAYSVAGRLTSKGPAPDSGRLAPRERECLLLAARGFSDWRIGKLLGLAERTVHHTIERAKRRLGVATRIQAVMRAIHEGQISTLEIVD